MKTDKQATLELITRQVDVMRVGQSVGMEAVESLGMEVVESLAKAQAEIELLCDAADWENLNQRDVGKLLQQVSGLLDTAFAGVEQAMNTNDLAEQQLAWLMDWADDESQKVVE